MTQSRLGTRREPEAAKFNPLAADIAEFAARFPQPEDAQEERRQAAETRSAKVVATEVVARSPQDNEALVAEISALRAELAERERRLIEVEMSARERVEAFSEAVAVIEDSTIWRSTAPLRALGAELPASVRMMIRRFARYAFWMLTPHRIPFRRRWFTFNPLDRQIGARFATLSAEVRNRLGMPMRCSYGPSPVERLDVYRTSMPDAPIFVFIHGGAWRAASASSAAFPAEMFVNAGVHFIVPDFIGIEEADGDLRVLAEQVRRSIAWAYCNAASFGGDPSRLYVGGHSSGGHLCGVALVTDWEKDLGLPASMVKGGILMSGLYEMAAVRAAKLSSYVKFTDEMEEAMSPQRHLDLLRAPLIVTCGTGDAPGFLRQSRDFAAAVAAAGKPVELIEAVNFGHKDVVESLGNPYGVNGRAALRLMGLSPPALGER